MLLSKIKRVLAGAMASMIAVSLFAVDYSAEEKKDDSKMNYQQYAAELDKTIYKGNDLGAVYKKDSTTFKVWSPKAQSVTVNIYEHGSDDEGDKGAIKSKALQLDKKTGVWSALVDGDLKNKYYTYTIKVDGKTKETGDVYAKGCGVNGKRSMIVDLSSTNPEGWKDDTHILVGNQTEATVWETSVADFSSSETSGVSVKHRGKFLAFTESGTTVNGIQGGTATCIDYLKSLGVKYVQIMPFYDFGSVDESKNIMEQYNWGYDPVNYNCPEGSYSTDPYKGEVRIKECKQMIKALHDAGIGVIMDVVYNHTYSTDSVFQNTVPNYYYRMNEDGTFSNGSGCSNDTASEHLMYRKYMIDSVTYWAKEYHIDGFRFDLMGLHDVTTMNEIREALDNLYEDKSGEKLLMYGEAWDMPTNSDEGTIMANQKNMDKLSDRIGAFDDTLRDGIKGSNAGVDKGFIQEGSKRSAVKTGIAGQSAIGGWSNVPTQTVSYTSCHDNLCFYDKLVDSVNGRNTEYRKRFENIVAMNRLAASIVITSQGIPFMLSGEEFGRSKDGDENSYASSRTENMIDWQNLDEYSDLIEYYRGLYKIRDCFPAFTDKTADSANAIEFFEDMPSGVIAYTLDNTIQNSWKRMCLIFNGSDEKQTINAKGKWVVLADNETAGVRRIREVTDSVEVEAHSPIIMVDKEGYEEAKITDSGALVVRYYDADSKELIKTQTITGTAGTMFSVRDYVDGLTYDIKKSEGDLDGEFKNGVYHAKLYVKKFEGKMSAVTFKFVDDVSGAEITDSYAIRNRSGQMYAVPEIPSVEGYKLCLDKLPSNGAGIIGDDEITVTYVYTHTTGEDDENLCTVNAIYMEDTGKVIETLTVTGTEEQTYEMPENEYEAMSPAIIPAAATGNFEKGEKNLVFVYTTQPDPLKGVVGYIYVAVGVIFALCISSAVYTSVTRKKKLMKALDIEE